MKPLQRAAGDLRGTSWALANLNPTLKLQRDQDEAGTRKNPGTAGRGGTDRRADEASVSPGGRHVWGAVPGRLGAVVNEVCLNFGRTGEAIGVVNVFYKEWETSTEVNIFLERMEFSLSEKALKALLY